MRWPTSFSASTRGVLYRTGPRPFTSSYCAVLKFGAKVRFAVGLGPSTEVRGPSQTGLPRLANDRYRRYPAVSSSDLKGGNPPQAAVAPRAGEHRLRVNFCRIACQADDRLWRSGPRADAAFSRTELSN